MHSGRWKYSVGSSAVTQAVAPLQDPSQPAVRESLGDLESDPGERKNLAAQAEFQPHLPDGRRRWKRVTPNLPSLSIQVTSSLHPKTIPAKLRVKPVLVIICSILAAAAAAAAAPAAALSADEQRLIAEVETEKGDFVPDLRAAVEIDSAAENLPGVRQMGERFRSQLTHLGFDSRFVPLPASTGRAGHLVADLHGTRGKRVLLIGHLDTVFPGANFRQKGTMVYGAGVNDMKSGDVIMIHALRALHRSGLLTGSQITVVMSGDEEAVGEPLEISRRDLREAAKRSDLALAFESIIGHTGTVARRGNVTWEVEVQGATGHSSGIFSPAVGSGAVFESARILTEFYTELRKLEGITINPALVAGGSEANLTRTGGTVSGRSNIIAQRVLMRGDLRFLSAEQLAEAQAKMKAIVAAHLPRTAAQLKFDDGYPAMAPTPANYALLAQLDQASRDLGLSPITAFDPKGRGAGDIAFVSPPLPGLDGLGLGGDGAHSKSESADVAPAPELIKRAALLIYRITR
jgi:glutamate carboxypeptidase